MSGKEHRDIPSSGYSDYQPEHQQPRLSILKVPIRTCSQRKPSMLSLFSSRFVRISFASWSLSIAVFLCAALSWAQQRPLETQEPTILPPGTVSFQFGFDFLQDAKYPLS